MTSHDARSSGRAGCTPFEEELVNAMNDFVNASDAPDFDTAGIVRRAARRKRTTVIAGIAATLVVAGGGTALAAAVSHDARPTTAKPAASSKPVATSTSAATSKPTAKPTAKTTPSAATLLLVRDARGAIVRLQLGGMDLNQAEMYVIKSGLTLGTISKTSCTGKPGSVIAVTPHAPKTVTVGKGTVELTACAA
jgi:beta-lactam-binding protein with PASTA domain